MAHRSRLAGFIIDCNVDDLDAAAAFWGDALGMRIADRQYGEMWPQVLATSLGYGVFLAVIALAFFLRRRWLRNRRD